MRKRFYLLIVCLSLWHSSITAGQTSMITLENAQNVEQIAVFETMPEKTIWDIAFSPDGHFLAFVEAEQSLERSGTIRFWDLDLQQEQEIAAYNQVNAVTIAFSPDGSYFAAGGQSGEVVVYDTELETVVFTFEGSEYGVNAIVFSPNGNLLAIASNFAPITPNTDTAILTNIATFKLVDTETGREVFSWSPSIEEVGMGSALSVSFNSTGEEVVVGYAGNIVQRWNIAKQEAATFQGEGSIGVASVVFSPNGEILAIGFGDGLVILWNSQTQEEVGRFEGGMEWFSDVVFNGDGSLLATSGYDGKIRLFDVQTQIEIAALEGHTAPIISLAFNSDGTLLASGGGDGTVRLWGVPAGGE